MWKWLRVIVLLLVLASVAQTAWLERTRATSWADTLHVAIYPVNGDGSAVAAAYAKTLSRDSFRPIERWLDAEANRHGIVGHRLVVFSVAPPLASNPPQPPPRAGAVEAVWFSLQFRFWAWRHGAIDGVKPNVRLFIRYFDPARHRSLPHSAGLQKGLVGIVNVFASNEMAGSNQVVIAHEMLHTLGASDKYDPATNQPRFPEGYADPAQNPLYPQVRAEIMAGRIVLTERQAEIPEALAQTLVGPDTAAEIGWRKQPR